MGVNRTNTEQFQLRMPPGLRDRIKAAAEAAGRSLNAEIVMTLEGKYPEPITLADTIKDIQGTLEILKRFKGNTMLQVLADDLDFLLLDISRSSEGTDADRKAVREHVENHGKFHRFDVPDID